MKRILKIFVLLLWILIGQFAYAQSDKEKALNKGREAIRLMDDGKIEESIRLLEEARKLDPDRFDYPYELALAHYMQEDYKEAIKLLEQIRDHKDVTERLYQLLGNSYDLIGKPAKSFEIYDAGLKKFPDSGILLLEKGNVHWNKKEYELALPYYEKGIEVDPTFPSNYYRAARLFCSSSEEVWGMIYGEIFMNLERNTNRTAEISKLLFDTYKSEIKFENDTSMTVSFCQQMIVSEKALSDPDHMKLPFCMVYEPTLLLSIAFVKKLDINSLSNVRTGFVKNYYIMGHNKTHPNILFEYQDRMLKADQLDAYNHWILMKGDELGFNIWKNENTAKWDSFVKWFTDNPLETDRKHKFYREQY